MKCPQWDNLSRPESRSAVWEWAGKWGVTAKRHGALGEEGDNCMVCELYLNC